MVDAQFKVTEHDEAGKITGTFVWTKADSHEYGRVDLIPPEKPKSLWQRTLGVFLPAGYPHSVTNDYLEYQIYDSLQAFASSIAGLLASRAALASVGVGDSTASPTAAMLLSILQESAGRIATILFAYRFGSALEPECKMYRLLADVLNDIGFILDCLSPMFPKTTRVIILSFSSVLRALCGVAAGSAKASLSAHFAKWGNLGELNAKDSSQETVISLIGHLAGGFVVSWVQTPFATWTLLMFLLSVHLETNRRAVRAVSMRSLNRQRATLVYHRLQQGHAPTPDVISAQEHIFERGGILRAADRSVLGYCNVGAPFSELLKVAGANLKPARSFRMPGDTLPALLSIYEDRGYLLWPSGRRLRQTHVVIKQVATSRDLLCAWWQSLILASKLSAATKAAPTNSDQVLELLRESAIIANAMVKDHDAKLKSAGWDLETSALETVSGSRITVKS